MWLKYREIAPGNAMKFLDFLTNGASGDMEIEFDQMFIILFSIPLRIPQCPNYGISSSCLVVQLRRKHPHSLPKGLGKACGELGGKV